ncbi:MULTISPECIES: SIMPL domain-containing protein [unclassified Novosphingobium]|uniref:SIMPL domain-containing protein n=1 Tax=unclassified Novosphingobium TaxID=2644732 RepID=UPI0025D0647C|nr:MULTISPECIES: SIMPL domain-containing protein [unclassified Novosphingobium]HQV03705.1 SIMPL domain-containing protein [Novosphingobium sp.]
MKSLKFALAPLALALAMPGVAMAHSDQPAIAATSTLLTISSEGKSARTPDLATFNAGVVTQGSTASEALAANAAAMTKVIATLKKAGIADKDIQTSQISLNPVYGQPVVDPNGQIVQEPRIVGYQATNSVNIRSRDIKGFGKVLDALVSSGANQVNGPSFEMSDPSAAMDEARTAAMKAARARAELYAKAAGLRVVRIVSISEGGGYAPQQPVYAMAKMADASSSPIAAGQVEAQISLTVQFELAP